MSTALGTDGSDGASDGATSKKTSDRSTGSSSAVQEEGQCEPELIRLCRTRQWNSVLSRLNHLLRTFSRTASSAVVSSSPSVPSPSAALLEEVTASYHRQGTALAVSCRYSAPPHVVGALLRAIELRLDDDGGGDTTDGIMNPLRVNAGGRGTPLHEAIGNEEIDPQVIRMLIQADDDFEERLRRRRQISRAPVRSTAAASERASSPSRVVDGKADDAALPGLAPRAACTQDVDGQIPLHLLVRRVFRACPRPTPSGTQQDRSAAGEGRDRGSADDDVLLTTLAELIESYPEGCAVPDRREYEETPLVLALKAQNYASYAASPTGVSDDAAAANANLEESSHLWEKMLERRIHVVVKLIVSSYPEATRYVASPTSGVGGYTMLHSALFHGRCADTLQLLLSAAADAGTHNLPSPVGPSGSEGIKAIPSGKGGSKETGEDHRCHHLDLCLHANSPQGEVPLHFAAMRMDTLPVLHMLTEAAPSAAHRRDQRGRTPLHWLWVRFVSTSLSEVREEPVTFLQMRHVPADYAAREGRRADEAIGALRWVQEKFGPPPPPPTGSSSTTFSIHDGYEDWLELLPSSTERRRHSSGSSGGSGTEGAGDVEVETNDDQEEEEASVTLEQARVVLFWSKMQILLHAAASSRSHEGEVPPVLFPSQGNEKEEDSAKIGGASDGAAPATKTIGSTILHDASSLSCCPRSVARIAASVHRDFLSMPDGRGRLPLHCAAGRTILPWRPHLSFSSSFSLYSPSSSRAAESALGAVLEAYPAAARLYDRHGRLPVHHAVEAYQRSIEYHEEAASHWAEVVVGDAGGPPIGDNNDRDPLDYFRPLLRAHPESVERRDGVTKLYPFMQAACSSDADDSSVDLSLVSNAAEARRLTVVYGLLRVCPSLVSSGIVASQSSSPSSSSVTAEVAGASLDAAGAGTACLVASTALSTSKKALPGYDPTPAKSGGDDDDGVPAGKRRRLDK